MLGQRPRRWPNIDPTLGKRLVFAGCKSRDKKYRTGIDITYLCFKLSRDIIQIETS